MAADPATATYNPFQTIYRAGDPADFVYFIQKGSVDAELPNRTVSIERGGVFGDGGITSGTYKATIRAGISGCTVLVLPMNVLASEIERSPPLVKVMLTSLFKRLEIAARLIGDRI